MERLLNDQVGAIPHYFMVVVTGHAGNLQGPVARMSPDAPLGINYVYTWTWRS